MTIRENIEVFWNDLNKGQRVIFYGLVAIAVILIVSGWVDAWFSSVSVRELEGQVKAAKNEAQEATDKAKKIAELITVREAEIKQVEVQRDTKRTEVKKAADNTNRAQSDYDRAVRERRSDSPNAEQLCRELANLGYPCADK